MFLLFWAGIRGTWIGNNSVINSDAGAHCFIGAGLVVVQLAANGSVVAENPTRLLRKRALISRRWGLVLIQSKIIWITWEKHRRTQQLANSLKDVSLFEMELEAPRVVRYLVLLAKTTLLLTRERPMTVIVQNPSVVLSLFLVTIRPFLAYKLIVDAHNEGLKPFSTKLNYLLPFYRYIQKYAHLTIVTNQKLAEMVLANGGNPFVLEDRLPVIAGKKLLTLKGRRNIAFICTFEKDEPFNEVIASAGKLPDDIFLYITGKKEKAGNRLSKSRSNNIVFTGFLPDQEYIDLLFSCDAIMDLTYMEDCLVCGAYEALSLNKPMILSDTEALRTYFKRGSVFTRNESSAIARSVIQATAQTDRLVSDAAKLRNEIQSAWEKKRIMLEEIILRLNLQKELCTKG